MAALTSAAVALYPGISPSATVSRPAEWYVGHKGSGIIARSLVLTLTGQGGQTNTIGASALGFTTLTGCTNLFDATNAKVYPATIDPINNVVILANGSDAPAPVDVTTTAAYITVTGTSKGASAS